MLELLSPAGSPEAVIAAVQNGADAIYMGFGQFNALRGARNFSDEEFDKAVRYCRIRGCKVYLALNALVDDGEFKDACRAARRAYQAGADAIIVQDMGLARALRFALPDIPLHASTRTAIHDLAGVQAAAELGFSRAVLARELSLRQIQFIAQHSPIELEVFVHGGLCFSHSGQCYMSALVGHRSDGRGQCAQPCLMQYSLGGRMDDYPLSLRDNCLVDRLEELDAAGVKGAIIEGRLKRPEYTAIVTGIYAKAIKDKRRPTPEEMDLLERAFSTQGFTQGHFDGNKENMSGVRTPMDRELERVFNAARRAYGDSELRRVPVHFYTVAKKGERIQAIAFDDDGHKAAASGPMPEKAKGQGITDRNIVEQMYKTGITPYNCVENKAVAEPGLYLASSEINELRRKLISSLTTARETPPERRSGPLPPLSRPLPASAQPKLIFQVRSEDQLCKELADLHPDYIYAPAMLMAEMPQLLAPFAQNGAVPVAVLPRVISDAQVTEVYEALKKLAGMGVGEALVGNLGHVFLARNAGMRLRGDFGLNVLNSYSLDLLKDAGFISATASFELNMAQVQGLIKLMDVELIAYGRLPVMVSDLCLMKASSGRCICQTPGQMANRMGSVFPVVKEFGCRNVVYNAHKLYLADKQEDLLAAGLWGLRMLFSTESARECVEVAKGYMGLSGYKPNVLTRGLYYKGGEN